MVESTKPAVTIQNLVNSFAEEALITATDTAARQKKTIDAVNQLLIGLLDQEAVDLIQATAKGNGGISIGQTGIGKSGAGNNQYFPSFNVRTPIVEVTMNGIPIYPDKLDIDTGETIKNAKVNFQDFKLTLPFGGVEKSIHGSISFFTKNPEEILAYLNVGQTGPSNLSDFSTSGLPTLTIKFGWAFSDSNTATKISKALSPQLTFIVTKINMSDPGVGGTTFTLSIQELGTIVLEHSSDDLLFDSNYPQEQIRIILEGLLHVRLFTLDDLLLLGKNNGVSPVVTATTSPAAAAISEALPANTIAPLSAVPNFATGGTIPGTGSVNKLPPKPTIPSTSVFQTVVSPTVTQSTTTGSTVPSPFVTPLSPTIPSFATGGTIAGTGSVNNLPITSIASQTFQTQSGLGGPVSASPAAPAAPIKTDPGQTFFITQPGPPVGVNGRNFFTLCSELASQCRCLWYPHDNTKKAVDEAVAASSGATTRLTNLANDLNMVKESSSEILDPVVALQVKKTLVSNADKIKDAKDPSEDDLKKQSIGMTKTAAITELEASLKRVSSRLATRSTLFWVPNIPADWETSGSRSYATGSNKEHTYVPYEEGAFFLLPDILDDYDIFTADLPVQYGPGASNLPYFYGSGQNVFQASLGAGKTPKLFGEVISISVDHNNLMVALGSAANESLAYAVNGKRIGQLETALNYQADKSTAKTVTMTPEEKAAAKARAAAKGNAILTAANAGQESLISQFKSRRFSHALALGRGGKLDVFDPDTLAGPQRSMAGADTGTQTSTGPAQSASYKIKSRVATFLRFPTAAKITILGDPNLIRLGPGCFELFSYYPVEHSNGKITQELNTLTSGLYFVTGIEHSINGGDFLTTLNGTKAIDPTGVPSSISGRILTKVSQSAAVAPTPVEDTLGVGLTTFEDIQPQNNTTNNNNNILNEFQVLDLNSSSFTTGMIGIELNNVFNTYEQTSTRPQ